MSILLEKAPSSSCDNEATTNLHRVQRDAEEGKNLPAAEHGKKEQREAVHCNAPRQTALQRHVEAANHRLKNRSAADRIHDGEQCGKYQHGSLKNKEGVGIDFA
jgi:hypothetical protein